MRTAMVLAIIMFFQSASAGAAEVRIVSVLAMKQVLAALAGDFEQTTGNKLVLTSGTVAQVQSRVEAGEVIDLVITNATAVDELIAKGKITIGSRVDLVSVGIGVAVRSGGPKPDISTVDSFKRALLAATSISRGNPDNRGAAGLHIQDIVERLGIAAEVKAKSRLAAGQTISEMVARGDSEIGIALTSEIVTVRGVELVGLLPRELQYTNVMAAGVPITANNSQTAIAMIDLLKSEAGALKLKELGLNPI
jgi:molybdate transport system substrate-binding protein